MIVKPKDKECPWRVDVSQCQIIIHHSIHNHTPIRVKPIRDGEEVYEDKYYNERKRRSIQLPFLILAGPKSNIFNVIFTYYQDASLLFLLNTLHGKLNVEAKVINRVNIDIMYYSFHSNWWIFDDLK